MPIDQLDPCLTVAFLCENEREFDQLCAQLGEIEDKLGPHGRSIISVQEVTPCYDEEALASMLSDEHDDESDDFVLM